MTLVMERFQFAFGCQDVFLPGEWHSELWQITSLLLITSGKCEVLKKKKNSIRIPPRISLLPSVFNASHWFSSPWDLTLCKCSVWIRTKFSGFHFGPHHLVWGLRASISELGCVAQMLLLSLLNHGTLKRYLTTPCLCVSEHKFMRLTHSEAKPT